MSTYEDMEVRQLDPSIKLVRGLCEFDGAYYRRWLQAYQQNGCWYGVDTGERIEAVDRVLTTAQVDAIAQLPRNRRNQDGRPEGK